MTRIPFAGHRDASADAAVERTGETPATRAGRIRRGLVAGVLMVGAAFATFGAAAPAHAEGLYNELAFVSSGLDITPGTDSSSGAALIQYYRAGGGGVQQWRQQWLEVPSFVGGGFVQIQNRLTGLCIASTGLSGDQLYTRTCDDNDSVVWKVNTVGVDSRGVRIVTITNRRYQLNVDAYRDFRNAGAPVIGYPQNYQNNQMLYVYN